MTVTALLEDLRQRDIRVWADGDLLRCSAPTGMLTADLRVQLQVRKQEILEFLNSAQALAQQPRAVVPLQAHGTRTPIFAVPGHNGDVFCYRAMARSLGVDQPFFGLQPPGVDGQAQPLTSVEELAAYFVSQVRAFRPDGPYVVAGYCAGGPIAFELGRQLAREGGVVQFIALFASPYPTWYRFSPQLRHRLAQRLEWASVHTRTLGSLSNRERRSYIAKKLRARKAKREVAPAAPPDPTLVFRARVEAATIQAVRRYTPQRFPGRVLMLLPSRDWLRHRAALLRWQSVATDFEIHCGPDGCSGDDMLLEPYAPANAEVFRLATRDAVEEQIRPISQAETELASKGA